MTASFQIGMYDLDEVFGGLGGGLRVPGHVIADVVFHQLAHEAIDGPANGGEALEDFGARLVLTEGATNAFELADHLLGAIQKVQFIARYMRHSS